MPTKKLQDLDGNTALELPVSKMLLKFRPAKGRDLIRLERLFTSLQDATGYVSNIEAMCHIAAHLAVEPAGITADQLLDLDSVDTMEVVRTVSSFPFINSFKG